MNIGIVGFGMVGQAISFGFELVHNIKVSDPKYPELDTLEDVVKFSDYIFVSVPTPMREADNNQIDLRILDKVIEKIDSFNPSNRKRKLNVILKSTIVPGTTRNYANLYPNINFIFSPEFLTERANKLQFINTARIILGGDKRVVNKCEKEVFRPRFEATPIFKTNWETAEFIKYMANCFLANKVIFMNIMFRITNYYNSAMVSDIDWDMAVKGFLADQRIGNSHYQVPGHDGDYGFGGKCFPKDLNAFINWLKDQGFKLEAKYFELLWEINLKYRNKKDWYEIEGAVSKDKK